MALAKQAPTETHQHQQPAKTHENQTFRKLSSSIERNCTRRKFLIVQSALKIGYKELFF